jgi:hypothetical protein
MADITWTGSGTRCSWRWRTSARPMKFALFTTNLAGGGAEKALAKIGSGLAERGHDVDFIVCEDAGEYAPPAGCRFHALSSRAGHGWLGKRRLAWKLALMAYATGSTTCWYPPCPSPTKSRRWRAHRAMSAASPIRCRPKSRACRCQGATAAKPLSRALWLAPTGRRIAGRCRRPASRISASMRKHAGHRQPLRLRRDTRPGRRALPGAPDRTLHPPCRPLRCAEAPRPAASPPSPDSSLSHQLVLLTPPDARLAA